MTPELPPSPPHKSLRGGAGATADTRWWSVVCCRQGLSCLLWLGVLVLATVGFALGCRPERLPPLRIATNPWIGYTVFEVAKSQGFFEDEGVEVHLVDQLSMSDSRRAFEQDQVDAFGCTLVEAILTQRPGRQDVNLIYAIDTSHGADVVLAAPDIPGVADLKGRRIGYEPGSSDILVIYLALRRHGLSLKDVTLVPMNQMSMREAAATRMVDAVPSFPPACHTISELGWKVVFDSSQSPGMILDVLAVGAKSLEQRRDDWIKVIRALDRALIYHRQQPAAAQTLVSRIMQLSGEEAAESEAGILRYGLADQRRLASTNSLLAQALERNLSALMESGVVTAKPPRLPQINLLGATLPQEGSVP